MQTLDRVDDDQVQQGLERRQFSVEVGYDEETECNEENEAFRKEDSKQNSFQHLTLKANYEMKDLLL